MAKKLGSVKIFKAEADIIGYEIIGPEHGYGDNHYDLLIPVEIEGKVTQEYLVNKWKKLL